MEGNYTFHGTHKVHLYRIWDKEKQQFVSGLISYSRRNLNTDFIDFLSNNFNDGALITDDQKKYRKLRRRYRVSQVQVRFFNSSEGLKAQVVN